MNAKEVRVLKANGELDPFDADKIRQSLFRAGAHPKIIEKIIASVKKEVYEGMPTSELYQIVFKQLKKKQRHLAGKYHLKRALMALGPSGFPFEKFIAAIWQAKGFQVENGRIVKGGCVSHEVDVVATKDELKYFVECKHHSLSGKICTVKTTLYVYARFLDIEKGELERSPQSKKTYKEWLVTNTRFTSEAIKYGNCVGLGLLSWDYPPGNGLREQIDHAGLHPVTCLTSLSSKQKSKLIRRNITLCRDLFEHQEVLYEIGVRDWKAQQVMDEVLAMSPTS